MYDQDTTGTKNALELKGVTKRFGTFVAVNEISLDIRDGEFFTLVGPSGSGKTTMIRMLVGMDKPSEGDIHLYGKRINDVPANKRPTCMVFQSLALFPHKSVGKNVTFPMKIAGVDQKTRRARARDLLKQVQLPEDYYDKSVMQCSGGERQRIALARALAFDPEILFFDEPLSALDFRLRKTLEKALKDLHRETGKTFVYITHSLEEAMVMSDRIGIMQAGRLVQVGTPTEIYNEPVNAFVAQFMGEINSFDVTRVSDHEVTDTSGRTFQIKDTAADFKAGHLIVRPEMVKMEKSCKGIPNTMGARILSIYPLGSRVQFLVEADGGDRMLVEKLQDEAVGFLEGQAVEIGWNLHDAILVRD